MQWLKHSVRSLSFVEISFLSAYSYDMSWYNSPSTEELLLNPWTAGIFHYHCTHYSWDDNEWWKPCLQDPFCHSYVLLSLSERGVPNFEILLEIHSRGKEQFHCTSQNGFAIHSCELQVSFSTLSPSGSSKTSLTLRPGSVHQTRGAWAKPEKKSFVCFDEEIEKLSWAACSFTTISHQPLWKMITVEFSK